MLRELALGQELVEWSAEVEPQLRKMHDDMSYQARAVITETQRDLLTLELMADTDERELAKLKLELAKLRRSATGENPQEWEITNAELAIEKEAGKTDLRKAEITRLTIQLERQVGILERLTGIYQKISAGGGASVWAALQRVAPMQPQQQPAADDRPVGPRRHFRPSNAMEIDAQSVDAE